MGKLFVANVTRQEQRVCYRLTFNPDGQGDTRALRAAYNFTDIPRGQQRPVGGLNLDPGSISEIIQQIEPYGALPVQDIGRQKTLVTFLYSIDKPVTADQILRVHNYNSGIKVQEGRERREKAAIALNNMVENVAQEQPKSFTVEYEQEEVSEADEKAIAEGYHVRTDGINGPPPANQPAQRVRGRPRKAA